MRQALRVLRRDWFCHLMLAGAAVALVTYAVAGAIALARANPPHCRHGYVRHGHRCVRVKPRPRCDESCQQERSLAQRLARELAEPVGRAGEGYVQTPEWREYAERNRVQSVPSPFGPIEPPKPGPTPPPPPPEVIKQGVYCERGTPWREGAVEGTERTEIRVVTEKPVRVEQTEHVFEIGYEGAYSISPSHPIYYGGRDWESTGASDGKLRNYDLEPLVSTERFTQSVINEETERWLSHVNIDKVPAAGSEWWIAVCVPGELLGYREWINGFESWVGA